MKQSEMAKLLTAIAQGDPRFTITADTADTAHAFWYAIAGHLDFEDAWAAAVAFYSTPTGQRIMPADLIEGVKAIHRTRLAAVPPVGELMEGVDYDDPRYEAIRRERMAAALRRPRTQPTDRLPAITAN